VIKVHLEWLEPAAAIGARDTAEVAQQLNGPELPNANAGNLQIPVPPVVIDVVCALA
jgi:hypothetical protein